MNPMLIRSLVLPAALGATLAGASATAAEGARAAPPADQLADIVVTATRRAESVQSVPVSISAISGEDLAGAGASQSRDLVGLTPNLSEQGSFGRTAPAFFIRGIGSTQFNPNANSKVGVYVDDVYLSSTTVHGAQLFDIDRIEVARGPQGTLFGQNTTAGLVRAITQRPRVGAAFEADTELTLGRFNQHDAEAAIGFGTGEHSAARLSVMDENRDGVMRNLYLGTHDGRTNVLVWRAQWLWAPSDAMDLLLNVHGSRDHSDLLPYKQVGLIDPATGGFCAAPAPGSGCIDPFGYADGSAPHEGAWNIPHQFTRVEAFGASATLTWRGPAFTLTAVSAYEQNTSRVFEDTDASPADVLRGSYYGHPRQFSQELRLTSPDGALRWIAGAYYFHEDQDSSVQFSAPGFGPSLFTGVSGVLEGAGQISSMKTDSFAAFGDIDLALAERWKLSLGLRATHETKEVKYAAFIDDVDGLGPTSYVSGSMIRDLAIAQTIDFNQKRSWNNLSGRMSLSYTFTDGILGYASLARGFNSGNYNGGAFFDQTEATLVNPETLKSYEVGLKMELGGKLRLNSAAFYYDFRDQQVFILASGSGGTPFQQLSNAAASSLYGAEVELAWKPVAPLFVQVGTGLTISRFDHFESSLAGDLSGKRLPSAPKGNLNALARYEWPTAAGTFALEVDGKYQSGQYFSVNNDPILSQPRYELVNARFSYKAPGDALTVTLWGRNLGDRAYRAGAYDLSAFGWDQWVMGEPRTYGVTAQYRFR